MTRAGAFPHRPVLGTGGEGELRSFLEPWAPPAERGLGDSSGCASPQAGHEPLGSRWGREGTVPLARWPGGDPPGAASVQTSPLPTPASASGLSPGRGGRGLTRLVRAGGGRAWKAGPGTAAGDQMGLVCGWVPTGRLGRGPGGHAK